MNRTSLRNLFFSRSSSTNSRRKRRHAGTASTEILEGRRLLSATNDLAGLSDEFSDSASQINWNRIHEVENWNVDQLAVYDINQTQADRLVMVPHTVVWYEDWRGPMAFKEVSGDFVFTTQVHVSDRDDVGDSDADDIPNGSQYSLAGAMIRTPRQIVDPAADWQPGNRLNDDTNTGENFVFLSLGHGVGGQATYEVKTTRNSLSQLELTPTTVTTATLQVARIGDTVLLMRQEPGQDWIVHERFHRPDLPDTLQVGMVTYTDWEKSSQYDPFVHNSTTLVPGAPESDPSQPFNPDLVGGFEYARYVRPDLPESLQGVDLLNEATDEQLLSFLGDHANTPAGPGDSLPTVSIQSLVDHVEESAEGTTAFRVSRAADDLSESLLVNYSVDGTAINGTDYSELSGSVTIPAGDAFVDVVLQPVDDSEIEGGESIELSLIDSVMYSLGDPQANTELLDDDFEIVDDQTMTIKDTQRTIELPATHPDGRTLEYSAQVVPSIQYELDQQFDFNLADSLYENWGGFSERWLRGDGSDWFYILPEGHLHQWTGSFGSSPLAGIVATADYDDPSRLVDVVLPASVAVDGTTLTIDLLSNGPTEFEISLTTGNSLLDRNQTFGVNVIEVPNDAPEFAPIDDQTVVHSLGELNVPFVVSDADGDELSISTFVVQTEARQLDQQYDFHWNGNDHFNWGGQNEKWIRGDGNAWFYILESGDIHRWEGGFATSPLIGNAGEQVHNSVEALIDVPALPVNAQIAGDAVAVTWDAGFVGNVTLQISADDGLASALEGFMVQITNVAPEIIGPASVEISDLTEATIVSLEGLDADGDALIWSAAVEDSELRQLDLQLGLQASDSYHLNWGGQNEKWVQGTTGWYYLLDDGSFYEWRGSFEASELVTMLSTDIYDSPDLLADTSAVPVSLSVTGNQLTILPTGDLQDDFTIRLLLTDGIETVTELLAVDLNL